MPLDSAQLGAGSVVSLEVEAPQVGPLRPGVSQRLDLVVTNPNQTAVVLTAVDVQVSGVQTPRASADRPCGVADFRASAGRFTDVVIGPRASVSLSRAGVPDRRWPRVAMLDSHANQDGCQEAQLVLAVRVKGRTR